MPKIALIILNYNNYSDSIELLVSLQKQTWFKEIEIYVVDNGSSNESVAKLQELQNNISFNLIILEKNLGFAQGNNAGIDKARNDGYSFIICSNSDILIPAQSNFLDIFISAYQNDQTIGAIVPNIANLEGTLFSPRTAPLSVFEKIKFKIFYKIHLDKIYYFIRIHLLFDLIAFFKNKKNSRREIESKRELSSGYVYNVHGSFFAFTPSFFNQYSGFDPNTFLYCEEFILAEMLHSANLKTWFETIVHVIHKESQSTNTIVSQEKEKTIFTLKHMFQSCRYFSQILR